MKTMQDRSTSEIIIRSETCTPLLFDHVIDQWPARQWTIETLAFRFPDIALSCKICPHIFKDMFWESECQHCDVTFADFQDWVQGSNHSLDKSNPLKAYSKAEYSCYIDYKDMKEIFDKYPDVLKEVDWGVMGLAGRCGDSSTIWVGSEGCYTNCHYDTYGFNLVAQIYGRKRWILFPPADKDNLYPTRLPYEESSVYSDINVVHPNITKHPLFMKCHPYVVDLEPGQVLYVPRHWWHYVQCLEPAISINTWVEMEQDSECRVHEAITKLLFMNLSSTQQLMMDLHNGTPLLQCTKEWLNPNEEETGSFTNLTILNQAVSEYVASPSSKTERQDNLKLFAGHFRDTKISGFYGRGQKRKQSDQVRQSRQDQVSEPEERTGGKDQVEISALISTDITEFLQTFTQCKDSSEVEREEHDDNGASDRPDQKQLESGEVFVTMESFTKCALHPSVIKVMTDVLLQNQSHNH